MAMTALFCRRSTCWTCLSCWKCVERTCCRVWSSAGNTDGRCWLALLFGSTEPDRRASPAAPTGRWQRLPHISRPHSRSPDLLLEWGMINFEVWLWSAGRSRVYFHFLHRDYPVEDSMKYIFEVIITPVVMFAKSGVSEYYYWRVGG